MKAGGSPRLACRGGKLAAELRSMCSSDMEPPIRPLVRVHRFEGEQIVVAEIPELDPAQKPCFYKGAGMTKGNFVRVSDGDKRLSAYEVQVTMSSQGQPRDDEQAVSASGSRTSTRRVSMPGCVPAGRSRLRT